MSAVTLLLLLLLPFRWLLFASVLERSLLLSVPMLLLPIHGVGWWWLLARSRWIGGAGSTRQLERRAATARDDMTLLKLLSGGPRASGRVPTTRRSTPICCNMLVLLPSEGCSRDASNNQMNDDGWRIRALFLTFIAISYAIYLSIYIY